jgi:hypothetical protein
MGVGVPIELDREDDGRRIAEIRDLPGTPCHGMNRDEAIARAQVLALRALAGRFEHAEAPAGLLDVSFRGCWRRLASTSRRPGKPAGSIPAHPQPA